MQGIDELVLVLPAENEAPQRELRIDPSVGAKLGRVVHSRNKSLTHDGASGQIRLPDNQESISSSHAEIKVVQAEYVVQDVGSLNGTWLDGRRLSEERAVSEFAPLRHGSLLRIGNMSSQCAL